MATISTRFKGTDERASEIHTKTTQTLLFLMVPPPNTSFIYQDPVLLAFWGNRHPWIPPYGALDDWKWLPSSPFARPPLSSPKRSKRRHLLPFHRSLTIICFPLHVSFYPVFPSLKKLSMFPGEIRNGWGWSNVQSSSYKINKPWAFTSWWLLSFLLLYCIVYLTVVMKINLKSLIPRKKLCNCVVMDVNYKNF